MSAEDVGVLCVDVCVCAVKCSFHALCFSQSSPSRLDPGNIIEIQFYPQEILWR